MLRERAPRRLKNARRPTREVARESGMESRTYRATLAAYTVPGTITWALVVLWTVAVWYLHAPWQPLLVPVAGFALVALRLSRFRVTIGERELTLRVPFQPLLRTAPADVLSVELASESGLADGSHVLSIRTSAGEELHLDARVFSREAVQRLLALGPRRLAQRLPSIAKSLKKAS